MSKKLVKRNMDLTSPPALTKKQKAELAALAGKAEGAIDTSDIPPLTEDFWKHAVRGKFYKPTKTSTTLRIDSDVLAWLRAQGKGYQSRINAILRRKMLRFHEVRIDVLPPSHLNSATIQQSLVRDKQPRAPCLAPKSHRTARLSGYSNMRRPTRIRSIFWRRPTRL